MSVFDPSLERQPAWSSQGDDGQPAMLIGDIRAAIADVVGGARQLSMADLDAAARIQVDRIAASAESLGRLVALTSAGPGGPPSPTDLDGLVAHLRQRFAGAAQEAGGALRVEMDPGLPSRADVDAATLTRVLENLVRAALARAPGSRVTIAASADGGDILFRIGGDRTAPAGAGEAAAIEATALRLAEAIGGLVELRSERDGRSLATLRLPGAAAAGAGVAPAGGAVSLAGVRVLLAEDNPTNQMVASNMLRALSAEVAVCSDGVEALDLFDDFPADLVVVDIEMPRLTGLDVIRAIRSRTDARGEVPIVALTAYAMREHRDRIVAAGANGLIPKPVTSVEALGRALVAHLGQRGGTVAPAPPPFDAPDPSVPVMDMAIFEDLCRTIGAELVGELMGKVVTDLVDSRDRLGRALGPFDRSQIEATSHVLISVAGAFGAVRLQRFARSLNTACRDSEMPRERIDSVVRGCIVEIDAAAGFALSRARA